MNRADASRYQVLAIRDSGRWLAQVTGLPGVLSQAHTLRRLDAYVRDLIGLALGLSAADSRELRVEFEFRTGDVELDRLIEAARSARRAAFVEEERARELTEHAVACPGATRLSRRDLAIMLDISHQRVQQIATGLPVEAPPSGSDGDADLPTPAEEGAVVPTPAHRTDLPTPADGADQPTRTDR